MHMKITPWILAATIGFAGAASASEITVGNVMSLDLKKNVLVLDDGYEYALPFDFRDPGFEVGEEVVIIWTDDEEDEVKQARFVSSRM